MIINFFVALLLQLFWLGQFLDCTCLFHHDELMALLVRSFERLNGFGALPLPCFRLSSFVWTDQKHSQLANPILTLHVPRKKEKCFDFSFLLIEISLILHTTSDTLKLVKVFLRDQTNQPTSHNCWSSPLENDISTVFRIFFILFYFFFGSFGVLSSEF